MLTNQPTKITNFSAIDEQLFTELAPEQAEILEGGLFVQISQLRCLQSGADGAGATEEVYATYNGRAASAGTNGPDLTFASPLSMRTNSVANVSSSSNSNGSIRVRLFDDDITSTDDLLGSFTVSSPGQGQRRTISGSGSTYEVIFSAF